MDEALARALIELAAVDRHTADLGSAAAGTFPRSFSEIEQEPSFEVTIIPKAGSWGLISREGSPLAFSDELHTEAASWAITAVLILHPRMLEIYTRRREPTL